MTHRLRGNRLHHVQFHQPIPQQFQGPTGTPLRRIATGQAYQARFALTVKHSRALPRAFSSLKRRLQALADTPFANLLHRSAGTTHPLGDFAVDPSLTVFAFIHQQENLGMTPICPELISKNQGLILVTGPTGSGKTVTQYSALNQLNEPERNILTIEDPVEIPMEGINQVSIHPKAGLTFASALRAFLRQDPDIIMVGEIRDGETAEIAVQSALTGHLVFSTLHTNDSASAITRLVDMGVEPFLISSSVLAVVAQRLVRVLCDHCKEAYTPGVILESPQSSTHS